MSFLAAFRTYYLPHIIWVTILFGIRFGCDAMKEESRARTLSSDSVLLTLGLIAGLSFFFGGIYHAYDAFIKPYRERRMYRKLLELDLVEFGLRPDDEQQLLEGDYKGFYLNVFPYASADSKLGEGVCVVAYVFADPEKEEALSELENRYELLSDSDGAYWFMYRVKASWKGNLSGETLRNEIRNLVTDLLEKKIEPLQFTD